MAHRVRYLTHPQVQIDPAVPVPQWRLSDVGRARTRAAAGSFGGTTRIFASEERKAVDTAEIIGAALGVPVEIRPAMHENDRSATGFLPPPEFEATADRFFAEPAISTRGWERALDAQRRIVAVVEAVLSDAPTGDTLLVGHGAVGTLLYCHYAYLAIDRAHDQLAGGGNVFAFVHDRTRRVLHPWQPMDA